MRFIITEDQYDKMFSDQSRLWVLRRYKLVNDEFKDTIQFTKGDIWRFDTYEDFEYYFFSVLMDCLHPFFYEEDHFDYKGVQNFLTDLFYVECTEFYFKGRERC